MELNGVTATKPFQNVIYMIDNMTFQDKKVSL